jgi:hypothetical protein
MVSEKSMLRVFGLQREEIIEVWRKLHNEVYNLYCLPDILA